MNYQN